MAVVFHLLYFVYCNKSQQIKYKQTNGKTFIKRVKFEIEYQRRSTRLVKKTKTKKKRNICKTFRQTCVFFLNLPINTNEIFYVLQFSMIFIVISLRRRNDDRLKSPVIFLIFFFFLINAFTEKKKKPQYLGKSLDSQSSRDIQRRAMPSAQ